MKASFNLKDSSKFKASFKLDVEFIEVLLTSDYIYFVNLRNGFYSHVEYPIVAREDFTEIQAFRIPRQMFLSILEDATISVEIMGDGYVTLYFTKISDDTSYTITIEHQVPGITEILDNIELLSRGVGKNALNLAGLSNYKSLFNSFGGIISVGEDGRVRLFRDDTDTLVFVNVGCDRVSIPSMFLGFLLDNAESYYAYRNVILGTSENARVIVHQAFVDNYNDFEYVTRTKSDEEFTVDFSPVYRLTKKAPSDVKNVGINLTSGKAFINSSIVRLATPFKSLSDKKDDALDLSKIDFSNLDAVIEDQPDLVLSFNLKNFNDIFPKAGSKLTIKVGKKNVLISNKKGVIFVIKRVNG